MRERERERERKRDRERERQRDRETKTERRRDREAYRERDKQTEKENKSCDGLSINMEKAALSYTRIAIPCHISTVTKDAYLRRCLPARNVNKAPWLRHIA